MRILTFTTLFPNTLQPYHGVFVENRLRHLLAEGTVASRVVAPVAWFPFRAEMFGDYALNAAVPKAETRHGIEVLYPRYPLVPKIGMTVAPYLLYRWSLPVLSRILRQGYDFELIDAHYFYPDGVAAIMLGRAFNKPVTITARGTDINLIPRYRLPRKMILWAAERAAGMITVCAALRDELVELGAPANAIRVLRNGVDLKMFQPRDKEAARRNYEFTGTTILSVGHLIERKGHDLVIRSLPELPGVNLAIAGDGPEMEALKTLARKLGVAERVRFLGRREHGELPDIYSAADVLVLASSREGWANVLLEAMACGTPVTASNVWGTPEVVTCAEAGVLLPERTGHGIAEAVKQVLAAGPDRAATRSYAERFSWDATTRGQVELFQEILARGAGRTNIRHRS